MANPIPVDTAVDTPPAAALQLCHSCKRAPVADEADQAPTNSRIEQLTRDPNPAVAHVAAAAIAHANDAEAWKRIANQPATAQDDDLRAESARKWALIHREVARELRTVAQDAKVVSTR